MNQLRLQIARGIRGLDELSSDWTRLIAELPDPGYMQLWEWHRSFLEALEPEPEQTFFCALHDGAAPVAILPLHRSVQRIGGMALTALQLPTHDHMHNSDVLLHPDWRARIDLTSLAASLATRGLACDVLLLGPVLEDSAARAVWQSGNPLLGLVEPARRSDALATGPHEELLDRLSKNFRGNLRKARNKLERLGTVRMVSARAPAELASALERFLAVEASGWKGQGGTGTAIANDPELLRFYKQIVERLAPAEKVEIHLLMVGDTAVAAQLAIVSGRRCYLMKIGYDEAHAALAPGNMLLERVLKQYEGHPVIKWVDLVSDAAWHESWKPETRAGFNHLLFRPTTKGLLAWAALQGKQALRPVRRRVVARWNEIVATRTSRA